MQQWILIHVHVQNVCSYIHVPIMIAIHIHPDSNIPCPRLAIYMYTDVQMHEKKISLT